MNGLIYLIQVKKDDLADAYLQGMYVLGLK